MYLINPLQKLLLFYSIQWLYTPSCLRISTFSYRWRKMSGRALHNLKIFVTTMKRVDFSEMTGVRVLSFRNVSMGETAGPNMFWGNAEGAKLPCRYVVEKTSSRASELKKSPSSLRKYVLCKALATIKSWSRINCISPFLWYVMEISNILHIPLL